MTDPADLTERRAKLTLAPADVNEGLVAHLEHLLAEAKRGELLGVYGVFVWRGAEYSWRMMGMTFSIERVLAEVELLREDVVRRAYEGR